MPFSQLLFDNLSWTFHTYSVWNGTSYHSCLRELSTLPHAPRFCFSKDVCDQQVSLSLRLAGILPGTFIHHSPAVSICPHALELSLLSALYPGTWQASLASSSCSVNTDRLREFCASCATEARSRALGPVIVIKATTFKGPVSSTLSLT